MSQVAEQPQSLAGAFEAFRRASAFGAGGLGPTRDAAYHRFLATGFPTTRHEEWRHTNIQPIANTEFTRAGDAEISRTAADPFLFAAGIPPPVVLLNAPSSPP